MDYFDFLRWLKQTVTPERAMLITESFEALENLTDAQVYDVAINLGSQLERTDTVSILDALNSDLLTLTENVIAQYGIKLHSRTLTLDDQDTLTNLLKGLVLLEGYETPARVIQILEVAESNEEALLELLEEVTGESALEILDLIDEVESTFIERVLVHYRKLMKHDEPEANVDPSYADKVRTVIATTNGIVANFINNGGGVGLPLDSYIRLFVDTIDRSTVKSLAMELFNMLLASGHLTLESALKSITERLDRFDISLKTKMELSSHLKRLYASHQETLDVS